MTTYTRIGAVTGANKGVGLAIVRQLTLQYPTSPMNNGPLLLYLTARNEERGKAAQDAINGDPAVKQAKALRRHGGLTEIQYHALDIDDDTSVDRFASFLKEQHPQGIDFLINNAAIAKQGFDNTVVRDTLHCNYYGTYHAMQRILPLIKDGGRLVNVASMSGHLNSKYSDSIKSRFLNATKPEDISQLMEDFTSAVAGGTHEKDWPSSAYAVSKAGLIGLTKVVARDHKQAGSKMLINVCCPGYVVTDMTRGGGVKTPDQGAQTPVMLAIQDIHDTSGEFWQHEKIIDWDK